jgi:broad specificity phosphatase PhoE
MSVLTLVRHGQASYLEADYDRLSPLGEEQARRLGAYWRRLGVRFDLVFSGPRRRHLRTAEIAGWPDPVVLDELDEYPAMELMAAVLPGLAERDPRIGALAAALAAANGGPERIRRADRLLRAVTERWAAGEVHAPGLESWDGFCDRVRRAVGVMRARAPKSSRTVAFTSGGPLAATAKIALGLTPRAALDLTWSPRNSALAEFLFSGDRFSLSSFNSLPHLDDPALWTYR